VAIFFAVVLFAALAATSLDDESAGIAAAFLTGLALLGFAVALLRGLPAHERRLVLASKVTRRRAVVRGVQLGIAIAIGASAIVLAGRAIDPTVARRLEDLAPSAGDRAWQTVLMVIALVVLAPLGEELLFRGLLLRALTRLMRFRVAAVISGLVFAAAHFDAYLIWPRAIALTLTGVALAVIYRRFGYAGAVTTHLTVNLVAAVGLLASG
jgi:membrane protease YdiL (CAAX protease family)